MRLPGAILILLAVVLAAVDVVQTLPDAARLRALGEWWFRLHPTSLQLLQPAIERHVSPALWDPWILTLLGTPAALVFGASGAVFLVLERVFRR